MIILTYISAFWDGSVEDVVLGAKMKREADRLLAQIGRANTMIVAVKAGARAEGFVLGLETAGALRAGDAESLYLAFESAFEQRLKILAS
ncbi:hypothetical protein PS723_04254 [Pseudomonas fluorescens]|uniref:Uncharacterized protein n=1 Tax=Pseudomonas fluorescens TaxID=294 RepID=A0A5E7DXZ6_PSEFL|nr:hypothetical protein PS723_04254 [Pseudomonas fluorescens]